MAEEEDEDYVCPEDNAYVADCTCDHDPGDHDWDGCTIQDCECKGHWEY